VAEQVFQKGKIRHIGTHTVHAAHAQTCPFLAHWLAEAMGVNQTPYNVYMSSPK